MASKFLKKKYVFLGDTNSINVEIICKSFNFLKKNISYILIGNLNDLKSSLVKIKSKLIIHEILNPLDFTECKKNCLNIYNIENVSRFKFKNLLNQLKLSNELSNITKNDLVTMAINKSIFKKKMSFTGVTEYLGKLNHKQTLMLMHGDNFSIIPFTTHINIKYVHRKITKIKIEKFLKTIIDLINDKRYSLKFNKIKFLCYNPHCGENRTIGDEDYSISNVISTNKKITGPYSSDSAFIDIKKNTLFISTYHDQALIPFKILNKKGVNLTLGLDYKRLSPAHGTALDIKYKNIADNSSYISCMEI